MERSSSDIIELQSFTQLSRFHHGVCAVSYTPDNYVCGQMRHRIH